MRHLGVPLIIFALFWTLQHGLINSAHAAEDDWWHLSPEIQTIEELKGGWHRLEVNDEQLRPGFVLERMKTYVVTRRPEPNENRGPVMVGRAAFARKRGNVNDFIFYQRLEVEKPVTGDRLLFAGDPATDREKNLIREAMSGLPDIDREIDDLYRGLMSFKAGYYSTALSTDTNTDSNYYKTSTFQQMNFGLRWWLDFSPQLGINFDYAQGTIPIKGFNRQDETGSQTNQNIGLLYRTRFLRLPTAFGLNYSLSRFSTSNPDDYILGSDYAGVNLNLTFYEIIRLTLLKTRWFNLEINNIEIGGGLFPMIGVTDHNLSRGTGEASGFQFNGGLELHIANLKLLKNVFFVFEGGYQRFSVEFSGEPSSGIQTGNKSVETQKWIGLRLKINIPDYLGELIREG